MRQEVVDLTNRLQELSISEGTLQETEELLNRLPELFQSLENPAESLRKRGEIIDRVFPAEIRSFLKELCSEERFDEIKEIFEAYRRLLEKQEETVTAVLEYVTEPGEEQLAGFNHFIEKRFHAKSRNLILKKNEALKSGFRLSVKGQEFDWSEAGRLAQLKEKLDQAARRTASEETVISILKSEVEDFELEASGKEIGTVNYVGDGIVNVDGIDHAMYGEIIQFDNGEKAMVQDIRTDEIGCILFGNEEEIREGSRCARTGKQAGIPVGEIKGRDLLPRHALAMTTALHPDAFPRVEVDYEQAIAYLRREAIVFPEEVSRGLLLPVWRGLPLGFVKNIGNRANNLYPQEWRIRHS